MMNRGKKIIITVISIILTIAIIAGVFAYLFIATDLFRSDKELFSKYAIQSIDKMKQLMNSETVQIYKDLEKNNSYEAVSTVNLEYSEGGEISNPLNDLALEIKTQKNDEEKYYYTDAQVLFQDKEYLEAELIRDRDLVGIRFSNVIKEFLTIRDDENLEVVADVLGVSVEQLQTLIETMKGTENSIVSESEIIPIAQKYTNIFANSIEDASFSNSKKSTISVNEKTIQANAYSAYFTNEQTRQIIVDILSYIKEDEEILSKIKDFIVDEEFKKEIDSIIENISQNDNIPEIKITVYEQKGTVVQTVIEIGEYKVTIEHIKDEYQVDVRIIIKDETDNEQIIQITKGKTENGEKYNVTINNLEEEEQEKEINIISEIKKDEEKIDAKIRLEYIEGITTIAAEIKNNTTITQDIEDKCILGNDNNVILNDTKKEILVKAIESFKTKLIKKTMENMGQLKEQILKGNEQLQGNEANSQIEINKFNAQFEFYTGDGVSAENVTNLLNIVKNNLKGIEYITPEQNEEHNNQEEFLNIKLNVEKDKENVELINSVIEEIKDGETYKVSISYNQDNGIIDYITIEEIIEE